MKDWVFIAVGFSIVAALVTAIILAERARRKAIALEMGQLRFEYHEKPSQDVKAEAFAALGPAWLDLRTTSAGVTWTAKGMLGDRPVTIVEHRYETGSGKNRHTHVHTIASTPAPRQWPNLQLAREGLFDKLGAVFGSKDFMVEDEAFNKRWKVKAEDEDFALVVLSPEVQAWSMALDGGTLIRLGGGTITIARRTYLKAPALVQLAKSCVELADLLPAELEAWERA